MVRISAILKMGVCDERLIFEQYYIERDRQWHCGDAEKREEEMSVLIKDRRWRWRDD